MLMITSVASMIKQFNMDNIAILQDLGYQVHVATNFKHGSTMSAEENRHLKNELKKLGVIAHHIDFPRGIGTPVTLITAIHQLSDVMSSYRYDFIHCQSPIGGVCGRLIGHKYKVKVLYTAHGFQFFHGGPKKDWLLFYPIEYFLARYTEQIITINNDDFSLAQHFPHAKARYIPGVGINYKNITMMAPTQDKISLLRKEFGIPENSFVIISVGELSQRKNHQVIIKALAKLKSQNVFYLICGHGNEKKNLELLAEKLNISKKVKLLGYRTDISDLLHMADISAFPSRREGLGLAGLEAMAAGLPLITSNVQGIKDYSINGVTGFVSSPLDVDKFAIGIKTLINDNKLRRKMGINNIKQVEKFDISNVNKIMEEIYSEL
ncbi:glycosyltransferase [Lactiplantibacillus argentoratensis]|nr:glycosyltransferase [Lactiplantibacillus argentoratensis]MBT1145134.1 glycosyltransferase [Lactiplantibacillus argentoratensis]MBT1147981.1 glycosyltransferase [Lactiplantibacillus argentoratensis]MBT1153827.1 glycosyltransferase [Lactiplantibacillus argentoratensis]